MLSIFIQRILIVHMVLFDKQKLLNHIQFTKPGLTPEELLHINKLEEFIQQGVTLSDIFLYGKKFLPNIVDTDGKKNLDLLKNYVPEILPYFDVLAQSGALTPEAEELATDLALYANGTSLEIDNELYSLDVDQEIQKIK